MTYATGTVTDVNPGPALYAAIEPTLFTAGFTLEDTVVIGSRTHKVLKSDASDNDQGLTWFLDVSFPTTGTSGGMLMTPFEDFDSDTDAAFRGPYSANSSTVEQTYFSRFGATGYALETQWANTASYSALDTALSTSATAWFLSATADRVIFVTSAAPGQLHYVGFFEPTADHAAHAGAALYPLIVAHFSSPVDTPSSSSSASANGALFTRAPVFPDGDIVWSAQSFVDMPYAYLSGRVGSPPHPGTGKTTLARRPVIMGFNSLGPASPTSRPGGLVGYFIDVVNTWTDGNVTRGDDLTDSASDVWISTDDQSNVALWFKAV